MQPREQGRLIVRPNGDHLSFARVIVPYEFFKPTASSAFEGLVDALAAEWDLADLRQLGLEPHVSEHVVRSPGDCENASLAVYEAPERLVRVLRQGAMRVRAKSPAIPFRTTSINLVIARLGIGYLSIEITPDTDDCGDLLDLVHHLRLLGGRAVDVSFGDQEPQKLRAHADLLIEALLANKSEVVPQQLPVGAGLPAYVAAFVDSFDHDSGSMAALRQRLRRMFHRSQPVDASDVDTDFQLCDLCYREGQWFFHSQAGGGFLAVDPRSDDFTMNVMPDHLRKAYFFGFEFALLQRHGLMAISAQIVHDWRSTDRTTAEWAAFFRSLREQLLLFTSRFRFGQIMSSQNRHADYRRWLEALEVRELHDEVRGEVADLYAYLTERREEEADANREAEAEWVERRGLVLTLGTALFVLPSLVIGFLGISINGVNADNGMTLTSALLAVTIGLVASLLFTVTAATVWSRWHRDRVAGSTQ